MKKTTKAKKVKLPEENVEYTLVFPGHKLITYVFCGVNDKGRLILMNVNTKTFTTMTPGWFKSLTGKRGQLVSKKPITDKQTDTKPKNQNFVVTWREETYEQRIIRELRTLTPAQALAVYGAIGYSADKLADELEEIMNDKDGTRFSNVYTSRVFMTLIKAQQTYGK